MAGTYDYSQMLKLVESYYGSGSDQWLKVAGAQGASADELLTILQQTPGIETLVTESGQYAGWRLAAQESYGAVSNVGSLVNSNTAGGVASVQSSGAIQVPGQFAESAGNVAVKSGAVSTGTSALQFVSGTVIPATIAVSTALKLGYTIDKALYDINPDIFTYLGAEGWNPDVMKEISLIYREEGLPLQEKLWNTIWGINPDDGTTQMYVDERQFAYMTGYLKSLGLFESTTGLNTDNVDKSKLVNKDAITKINIGRNLNLVGSAYGAPWYVTMSSIEGGADTVFYTYQQVGVQALLYAAVSKTRGKFHRRAKDKYSDSDTDMELSYGSHDNYGVSWGSASFAANFSTYTVDSYYPNLVEYVPDKIVSYRSLPTDIEYLITQGEIVSTHPDGINTQNSAVLPDVSTSKSIDTIIAELKQQYPELWDSAVTNDVLQPDGSIKTFTYLPLPTPTSTGKYDTQPTGDGSEQNQNHTDVSTSSSTEVKNSTTTTIVSPPTTPNPPDTGDGDSPTVVPPVGKASSLWSIYNPTLEQVNQFGSWLWSSDFVEQLKKLFSDPMQAIIGLHKVYSPVQTSGVGTIKCGYLDSAVPSKLVSEQYTTVDCGSVDLQEYFGNVFDYPPYTEVSIYLPFIGIRQLDPSDVMRSTISVKYHIDVLTGACLAEVNVQRDAAGGTLYTFSGDAAVRYPVSSGSYMGIVSGLIGVATSVVSGNLLPALGGVTRLHTNVERSGSFTGNSGAMGSKIPYLIISRPQTAMADNFETLSGYPSNAYTPLSACTGFTQVKFCHVENLTATDAEKQEIERMLKEGVIL